MHSFGEVAVDARAAKPRDERATPIQCKKVIRNGVIVDVPDDQETPPFVPFSGQGQRVGGDSHVVPGRTMVSRSVARQILGNVSRGQPPFRPELGEVGRVSWAVTGGNPHTGIQNPGGNQEPKDVPLGVEVHIPRVATPRLHGATATAPPQPREFSNEQLMNRLAQAPHEIVNEPTARRAAEDRLREGQLSKLSKEKTPHELQKSFQLIYQKLKSQKTAAEARKAAFEELSEQVRAGNTPLPAQTVSAESVPPAVAEKHMWTRLGEETGRSSSGISFANLEQGPLSLQGPGQFALVAPQARHTLRLTADTLERLREEENTAEREAAYARYQKPNAMLRQLHFERLEREQKRREGKGQ